MIIFSIIFISIFITWSYAYIFFYSPKAQIKRLWEEIFEYSFKINEQNKLGYDFNPLITIYEGIIMKKEKMIHALLDYYFNHEEYNEYVRDNRPKM